jgi:hypothetical protein
MYQNNQMYFSQAIEQISMCFQKGFGSLRSLFQPSFYLMLAYTAMLGLAPSFAGAEVFYLTDELQLDVSSFVRVMNR